VFTLQQTLTNITMTRELALDHARQYFELFYETPEEILNNVLENGPQFSELEYINAFQLIARSQQEYVMVNKNLEKLSEILGDVGVTV
jgi:exocyst complex component 4